MNAEYYQGSFGNNTVQQGPADIEEYLNARDNTPCRLEQQSNRWLWMETIILGHSSNAMLRKRLRSRLSLGYLIKWLIL